jgi:hypothetical protein
MELEIRTLIMGLETWINESCSFADFHSMWLMGRVLRDSCAFFMRRSFGNDKLYWSAFSEYVQKLVTDGESAIEFFIEGTRSRTAKSLMPKFGKITDKSVRSAFKPTVYLCVEWIASRLYNVLAFKCFDYQQTP